MVPSVPIAPQPTSGELRTSCGTISPRMLYSAINKEGIERSRSQPKMWRSASPRARPKGKFPMEPLIDY
jgi:hypothetical protein